MMRAELMLSLAAAVLPVSVNAQTTSSSVAEILLPSVVRIEIEGTGPTAEPEKKIAAAIIISEDGYALTATHNFYYHNDLGTDYVGLPKMGASMQVASGPLQAISFEVIEKNPRARLTLIKLRVYPGIKYRPARLCASRAPRLGDALWAMGFSAGEELAIKEGPFDSPNGPNGMWQTGILAAPGFSGGPVSLADGSVVALVEGALATQIAGTRVVPVNLARPLASIAGVTIGQCGALLRVPDQSRVSQSWRLNYVSQQIDRLYAPLNLKLQKGESEWSQFQEDFKIRFGRRSPTLFTNAAAASGETISVPLAMTDPEWAYWISRVRALFKPHNDAIEQLVGVNVAFLEGGNVPACYQEFLRHTAAFNASLAEADADPSVRVWNPRHSWPACFVPEVAKTLKELTEKQNSLSAVLNAPFARPEG